MPLPAARSRPVIRPATEADVGWVLAFIAELAEYERLTHQLETSAERLREHLFGPRPVCEALLACEDAGGADGAGAEAGGAGARAEPVGFALFFTSYSTFKTRPCLHLEDLYVRPAARGRGHGKALLQAVAARAVARGCARVEWVVLDWNAPAIAFYESLGAMVLPDWRTCRVDGDGIARLAGGAAAHE